MQFRESSKSSWEVDSPTRYLPAGTYLQGFDFRAEKSTVNVAIEVMDAIHRVEAQSFWCRLLVTLDVRSLQFRKIANMLGTLANIFLHARLPFEDIEGLSLGPVLLYEMLEGQKRVEIKLGVVQGLILGLDLSNTANIRHPRKVKHLLNRHKADLAYW